MDTTAKGNAFEIKVKRIIDDLLAKGEFSIAGKHFEVFYKKGYFSEKRKGEIVVDISIEFRRTKRANPSVYVFIECKDYQSSIPVNDVEEFYSKTTQISGVNTKAMLFTTSNIQEGALNFASSVGMAVVRVLNDDELAWLIERTNKNLIASTPNAVSINIMNALLNENFVSTRRDTFAFANGVASYEVKDIIPQLFKDNSLDNV